MGVVSLPRARRREIRRQADQLVGLAGKRMVKAITVTDLLPVAGDMMSVSITLRRASLPSGMLARTVRDGNSVSIEVSHRCMTVQHTILHEIGHLTLGHEHLEIPCVELDIPDPPKGFERFLSGVIQTTSNEIDILEAEAELFADRLTRLIPMDGSSPVAREWMLGIA